MNDALSKIAQELKQLGFEEYEMMVQRAYLSPAGGSVALHTEIKVDYFEKTKIQDSIFIVVMVRNPDDVEKVNISMMLANYYAHEVESDKKLDLFNKMYSKGDKGFPTKQQIHDEMRRIVMGTVIQERFKLNSNKGELGKTDQHAPGDSKRKLRSK